ncbi:MAG: TonB-dependent receptor [bacterium]
MKFVAVLWSVVIFSVHPVCSQSVISGRVLDEFSQQPIESVNISDIKSATGTVTDSEGHFTLNTTVNSGTLEFTAVGYEKNTVKYTITGNQTRLNEIYLKPVIIPLDEITITAGMVKEDVESVAVSTISARTIRNELGDRPLPFVFTTIPGIYTYRNGGGSGDAELSIRGFNQENVGVLLNGVPINGVENGLVYWSNWLGLSNTAAEIQIQKGPGVANTAFNAVGGTINIVTEPALKEKGGAIMYQVTSYGNHKITLGLNSGLLKNGWSISFMGSFMYGPGYIDATYVRGMSYFLAMSKQFNERNKITLTLMGAPQRHGQRTLRLSETENRIFGNRFNKDWGSLNGEINNASENFYHRPFLGLSHYLTIDSGRTLATTLYFIAGTGGGKWSESFNYAPSIFEYRNASGQIDWPTIVNNNANSSEPYLLASGDTVVGYSLNVQTNFLASHIQPGIISTYKQQINPKLKLVTGLHYRYFNSFLREEISDLLGGNFFVEDYSWAVDGVAGRHQIKSVGDIIKVNNNSIIHFLSAYAQLIYERRTIKSFVSVSGNNNWYLRQDRYNYISDINSETIIRPGYDLRAGISFEPALGHTLYMNGAWISRAPYFKFVFGNFTNVPVYNLQNENITTLEGGYSFEVPVWTIQLNGFYTRWGNVSLLSDEYVQLADNRQSRAMIHGLDALHRGLEAEITFRPDPRVRLGAFGLLADYRWKNDVTATLFNNDNIAVDTVNVFAENLFVGGSAQQQVGLYGNFRILNFFNLRTEWFFNDKIYASFNPSQRNDPDDRSQPYRIPSYTNINLFLGIPFPFFNNAGLFQVNVYNLTGANYIEWGEDGTTHDLDSFRGFWTFGRNLEFLIRLNF